MARFYHLDVARWEGEGGAPAEGYPSRRVGAARHTGWRHWRSLVEIALGAALVALLAYARRKVKSRAAQDASV